MNSVVCEVNKKIFGAKIINRYNESKELLKEVWLLMTTGNYNQNAQFNDTKQLKSEISSLSYLQLLYLSNDYGKGPLTDLKKEIIWNTISNYNHETRQRYLTETEFIRYIPLYLGTRIMLYEIRNQYRIVSLCKDLMEYQMVITSNISIKMFELIFDLITIAQCILTFIRISTSHCKPYLSITLSVIDYIWIFEIFVRLLVTNWREYCRSRHLLNGIITMIVIIVSILDSYTHGVSFERLDDSIELLRLFCVTTFIIKCIFPTSIWSILNAITYSLRSSAPILIHLLLTMYSFAVIGMDLFGGINFEDINPHETDDYIWGSSLINDKEFQSFNFRCFNSAMHQSFIGVIANNWHVFMFGYAQIFNHRFGQNSWKSSIPYFYFIVLMIIIPSILLQVFCAVLLDIFDSYCHHQKESATTSDQQNKIQQNLQETVDELYPNKYKLQCADMRLNDFYQLPHKDVTGIKYWIS